MIRYEKNDRLKISDGILRLHSTKKKNKRRAENKMNIGMDAREEDK